MFRPRIIPVLLLQKSHLVKSVKFRDYTYIGDPINAVKLYNEMRADELVFLDISATRERRLISLDFVREVGEEANMPFAVGGGIRSLEDIRNIIAAGAEKVVVGTQAATNPGFIKEAAAHFGSSTVAVCIDVKKNFWGKEKVVVLNGSKETAYKVEEFAALMNEQGAGEIIIQSVDRDGAMGGYHVDLVRRVSEAVTIPVVALGGAGSLEHMREVYQKGLAHSLGAGSIFVYRGSHKGVLINYPDNQEKKTVYE